LEKLTNFGQAFAMEELVGAEKRKHQALSKEFVWKNFVARLFWVEKFVCPE